jgi:predicted metal-dependent HD superfamily phosphohydrolase
MNLQERFTRQCLKFTNDPELTGSFWTEIYKKYTEKGRHYHNLRHLENMFAELDAVKDHIADFSAVAFSVFYHDVIYDATSKANEEKSAALAVSRLQKLNIHQDVIHKVSEQIIATKAHQQSHDSDTNYLLDADLSVLGKDRETYLEYTRQIRKEYAVYPDFLYRPGRKKVLQHFSELESIFKTDEFRKKYEGAARENISWEIGNL